MKRILYIQYTNPGGYPPLEHSSRILASNGWSVLFLGTGALGADSLRFPAHPNITVRRMPFCPSGWRQKPHYLAYCLWVLLGVLIWRPKWVYASDPLACLSALIASWVPGLGVLYHEHDSPGARGVRSMSLIMRARHLLANRAELCILPNSKRLERFIQDLGPIERAVCVWNCPAKEEVSEQRQAGGFDAVWLVYHGSIGPHLIPRTLIHALSLLPDRVRLRVTGYETVGTRGYIGELTGIAAALGIAERVKFRGPIPRYELFRDKEPADIGLALMPMLAPNQNFEGLTGASNKAFDYLACGLPFLVSDLPDWRQMFVDPGYALACDPGDPQSIAAAISRMIENPDPMRAMGEAGRQRILMEWNYETQFQPVLEFMTGKPGVQVAPGKCDAARIPEAG
jgi:glycosyltransferase involved in cell wall biosynthesis